NQDGLASVGLEGMACGLPVIVPRNTGAGDCVEEGREGFIIEPGDEDALIQRLEVLRADRDRCREMGRSARERARRYTWSGYQGRLVQLIRERVG
ncbi:MAG: glycosyltransferase, partial [Planctomycetes bacterium]|nr:glycosyltransferase [Planctomycetota bacterium]